MMLLPLSSLTMPVTGKILLLPLSCRPPYATESALAAAE